MVMGGERASARIGAAVANGATIRVDSTICNPRLSESFDEQARVLKRQKIAFDRPLARSRCAAQWRQHDSFRKCYGPNVALDFGSPRRSRRGQRDGERVIAQNDGLKYGSGSLEILENVLIVAGRHNGDQKSGFAAVAASASIRRDRSF
jgi:hypothetical protein